MPSRPGRTATRREFIGGIGCALAGAVGGFALGNISASRAHRRPNILTASEIFERSKRAVVIIRIGESFGAGFCLDRFDFNGRKRSFIATADHVTGGSKIESYQLDVAVARIVAQSGEVAPIGEAYLRDGGTDLALFSCDIELLPLPVAPDPPKVGESVFAIGHPRGEEFTLSSGIVSGYVIDGAPRMRITAPISPGSSGGPVINQRGEVVGVVSSTILESQNLNHVVPLSELHAAKFRLRMLNLTV